MGIDSTNGRALKKELHNFLHENSELRQSPATNTRLLSGRMVALMAGKKIEKWQHSSFKRKKNLLPTAKDYKNMNSDSREIESQLNTQKNNKNAIESIKKAESTRRIALIQAEEKKTGYKGNVSLKKKQKKGSMTGTVTKYVLVSTAISALWGMS